MPVRRALPLRVERLHHVLGVHSPPDPAGELRLDVALVLGALGKVESEPAVERNRPRHVADDDAEEVQPRSHDDASAVSAVRKPSSAAIGCRASTTLRMCSSRSIPRPSAPAYTSSRWTPAANDGCFSFFFTDFGSSPSSPVGRTRPHAWMNPESSSQAKTVRFRTM